MTGVTKEVGAALRLGWAMAEARGRSWPGGPEPSYGSGLPLVPQDHLLPLRSQRVDSASRTESVSTLVSQVRLLRLTGADTLSETLMGERKEIDATTWRSLSKKFLDADAYFQDELAQKDDALANAYLLGRGLAECFWGLGRTEDWGPVEDPTGVSLAYLFGPDRRRELTRMLGRLKSDDIDPLSASVIAGSLEAWGDVAREPKWSTNRPEHVRAQLYEQVRRWYQLLVLGQDPTTLIQPSARLGNRYYLVKTLRAFWLQGVLAVVALVLTSVFFLSFTADFFEHVKPLLATGGVSAFAAAGLLTKGQSAAQRMLVRLRQDAYTDLVAVSVTVVPDYPGTVPAGEQSGEPSSAQSQVLKQAQGVIERAVRKRTLTPPTPPKPI